MPRSREKRNSRGGRKYRPRVEFRGSERTDGVKRYGLVVFEIRSIRGSFLFEKKGRGKIVDRMKGIFGNFLFFFFAHAYVAKRRQTELTINPSGGSERATKLQFANRLTAA